MTSLRVFALLTLILGAGYTALMTAAAQALFPHQANGSLIESGGKIIGSQLIAQKFESPRYFHPRPSAADFATVASGASNLAPSSAALKKAVEERRAAGAVNEMLYASGSGLDPHISLDAALSQVPGIVQARGLGDDQVRVLVMGALEDRDFGFLGERRINVLKLNLALDGVNERR